MSGALDAARDPPLYSLQALPAWYPQAEYRRRLVRDGMALQTVVSGDEIELQLSIGDFTLLGMCYDYFDGCQHWLYLLDRAGKPVDKLSMPDAFGCIQDVVPVSVHEIAFGYYGTNDRWNVTVRPDGFRSLTPGALRRRLNGFMFARRYLEVLWRQGAPWSFRSTGLPEE